jgi:hypothetical protein
LTNQQQTQFNLSLFSTSFFTMSKQVSAAATTTKNNRPVTKRGGNVMCQRFWEDHGWTEGAFPDNKCAIGFNAILQCAFGKDKAGRKKDDTSEAGLSPEEYAKLHDIYAADAALMDESNPNNKLSFISKIQNIQLTSIKTLNEVKQQMDQKNNQQQQQHKTELDNLTKQLHGLETNTTNTSKLVVKVGNDLKETTAGMASILGGLIASVSDVYDNEDPLHFWADQTFVYMNGLDNLALKSVRPADLAEAFELDTDSNRLVPSKDWIWPAEASSTAAEQARKAVEKSGEVQPQEDKYTGPITKYHLVSLLYDLSSTVAKQATDIKTLQDQMEGKVNKSDIETVKEACNTATTKCTTAAEACTKATEECNQATEECKHNKGAFLSAAKLHEDTVEKHLETEAVVNKSKEILDKVGQIPPETISLLSDKEALTALTSENRKREREEKFMESVDEIVEVCKKARVESNDMAELKKIVGSLAQSTKIWVDNITATVTPEKGDECSSPSP